MDHRIWVFDSNESSAEQYVPVCMVTTPAKIRMLGLLEQVVLPPPPPPPPINVCLSVPMYPSLMTFKAHHLGAMP